MNLTLGTRIKITRTISRKTLDEVANETSIKKGNLSRYENDKVIPRFDTVERIEKSIGKLIPENFKNYLNEE